MAITGKYLQHLKNLYRRIKWYWRRALEVIKSFFRSGPNRLIFELAVLFSLVCWAPYLNESTPNALSFNNETVVVEIFSIIAGALASILGIAVAFVIVTFELSRRYFSAQYSAKKLFKSEALRELVVLYSGTILIAMGGLASLHSNEGPITTRLAYLAIYLFVISILVLIPRVRQIILQEDARKEVEWIVGRIEEGHASHLARMEGNPYAVSHSEGNPLALLADIGKKSVENGEPGLAGYIAHISYFRFEELTKDYEDNVYRGARDIMSGFSFVVFEVAKAALQKEDTKTLRTAFYFLVEMAEKYAQQKRPYHHSIEAEERIERLVKLSIEKGLTEVAQSMLFKYQNYFEFQITHNAPLESELWEFNLDRLKARDKNEKIDHGKSNHWRHISDEYISAMAGFAEESIKHRDEEVLRLALSTLNDMAYFIMKSDNLGDGQKSRALRMTFYRIESCYKEIANENFIKKHWFILSGINEPLSVDELVKSGKHYTVWGIQTTGNIFIEAAKKGVLETHPMNDFGATGRTLVKHVADVQLAERAVIYIADTFSEVRKIVETDLSILKNAQIYLESHSQIDSLKRWLKHENVKNLKISRFLNKQLKAFTQLEKAQEVAEKSSPDRWKLLFGDADVEK